MQGDTQQRSKYRFDEERNCWQLAAAVRSYVRERCFFRSVRSSRSGAPFGPKRNLRPEQARTPRCYCVRRGAPVSRVALNRADVEPLMSVARRSAHGEP